jgi:hypothetical protein
MIMKRRFSSAFLLRAALVGGFIAGCNQAPLRDRPTRIVASRVPLRTSVAATPQLVPVPTEVAAEPAVKAELPEPVTGESGLGAVSTNFARGPQTEERKSYVDTTAQPSFGHAPDYTWLAGEVQYSSINKRWRLRYASVDEDDVYGGSVTLSADSPLDGLKDGMLIRVQGELESPGEKRIAPPYRAANYHALNQSTESNQPIRQAGAAVPSR